MTSTDPALKKLLSRRGKLWERLAPTRELIRGSVVILRRPCTYKGCRQCASGRRHAATYLGYRDGGKLRWVYLPKALVGQATRWVENYRSLEERLRAVSLMNVAILRERAGQMSQKRAAGRRDKGRRGR